VAQLLEPFAGNRAESAAHRLITHFGGLGRALSATPAQLERALADDRELAAKILAARSLFEAALHEKLSHSTVSAADPDYRRYLRLTIGKSPVECLHATYVTSQWGYLADDRIATGTPAQVELNLRFFLGRAFDVGAHGVLLAHNHPSGSAEPSAADIAITQRIARLTQSVGVLLLDHLIIGADAIVSMKERKLL